MVNPIYVACIPIERASLLMFIYVQRPAVRRVVLTSATPDNPNTIHYFCPPNTTTPRYAFKDPEEIQVAAEPRVAVKPYRLIAASQSARVTSVTCTIATNLYPTARRRQKWCQAFGSTRRAVKRDSTSAGWQSVGHSDSPRWRKHTCCGFRGQCAAATEQAATEDPHYSTSGRDTRCTIVTYLFQ